MLLDSTEFDKACCLPLVQLNLDEVLGVINALFQQHHPAQQVLRLHKATGLPLTANSLPKEKTL